MITATGATSGDYAISLHNGNLTVTKRAITVTAAANSKIYDGTSSAAATPAITSGSLAAGDTANFTETYDNRNVGTSKTLNPAGSVGDGNSGNDYAVTFASTANGTITPRAIIGSITAANKVYDGTTAATITSRTLSGVLGTDQVSYVGGTATFSDANVGNGKTVTATGLSLSGADSGNYTVNATATTTANILPVGLTVGSSILVLNQTLSGALSLSGNASINISGSVMVDSNSATAISASGNAVVTASSIGVVGGVGASGGNVSFSSQPTTHSQYVSDPLLLLPDPTSGNSQGSVNLTNGSLTINPGIYSSIKVAGNASLTLNPGVYILAGGDFSVTGTGGVTGTGVTIYNAGKNTAVNPGGNFGGISLSGNGSFRLTAPTTGNYAGVLIFQARDNTRALSLSGNAVQGMTGTVYAPAALLTMSGNSQETLPLIVNQLKLSGNGSSKLAVDGSTTATEDSVLAGQLLSSDLWVYVNNTNGLFSADDLARLQDAISGLNTLLAPYGVTINQVDSADSALANVVIDTGTTSASGGLADGVLGCEVASATSSEITLIQGWNWYAGANASGLGSDQYDFQTIVTHELGHALGLGHSADLASTMYATLAAGSARRVLTTSDLSIPDSDGGAPCALHAAIPTSHVGSGFATGAQSVGGSFIVQVISATTPTETEWSAQGLVRHPAQPDAVRRLSRVTVRPATGTHKVALHRAIIQGKQVGLRNGDAPAGPVIGTGLASRSIRPRAALSAQRTHQAGHPQPSHVNRGDQATGRARIRAEWLVPARHGFGSGAGQGPSGRAASSEVTLPPAGRGDSSCPPRTRAD